MRAREFDPKQHAMRLYRKVNKPFSAWEQAKDFCKVMWLHLAAFAVLFAVLIKIVPHA